MNIGERIKKRREELQMSAEELGNKIGKAKTTIYRYETGAIENMPSSILEPIANALMTTPAYLMGWTDNIAKIDYKNEITENELLTLGFSKEKTDAFFKKLSSKDLEKVYAYIQGLLDNKE